MDKQFSFLIENLPAHYYFDIITKTISEIETPNLWKYIDIYVKISSLDSDDKDSNDFIEVQLSPLITQVMNFQMDFPEWELVYFDWNLIEISFWGSN